MAVGDYLQGRSHDPADPTFERADLTFLATEGQVALLVPVVEELTPAPEYPVDDLDTLTFELEEVRLGGLRRLRYDLIRR